MNELSFETLLDKYLTGSITAEERQLLYQMLELPEHCKELEAIIDRELLEHAFEGEEDNKILSLIQDNIQRKISLERKPAKTVLFYIRRLAVAAIFILLLGSGIYLWFESNKISDKKVSVSVQNQPDIKNDIAPGSDGAILTMADGTQIVLDSAQNGALSQQGSLKIIKKGGQVIYSSQGSIHEVLYNTMITQRGKQFQLVMADGSKVWLNAASSIRFPTSFVGKERKVEITGEAYFEVAKNSSMPFKVIVHGMEVEVLGTHFNVNAYDDEASIRTTLLEGKVKVTKGGASVLLKSGQQSLVSQQGEIKLIDKVDVEAVMAWKNGRFLFDGSDLKTIMGQVMRWYDVDVVYEGKIPERFFSADISRNTNLSVFLKVLEVSGIHFRIEGRKLIVMP